MACSLLRLAGRSVTTAVRGARALSSAVGTGKNCVYACVRAPSRNYACMIDGCRVMVQYLDIILLYLTVMHIAAVCLYIKYGHFEVIFLLLFMYCIQQQQLLTGISPPQLWGRQP